MIFLILIIIALVLAFLSLIGVPSKINLTALAVLLVCIALLLGKLL
jgi:hypothetical protein